MQDLSSQRVVEAEIQAKMKEAIRAAKQARPQGIQPAGLPQGGVQSLSNTQAPPSPGPTPGPFPSGGNPGNLGGSPGAARNPSQYSPYKGRSRDATQQSWNSNLDAVPSDARAGYTPDLNTLVSDFKASGRNLNPADLESRAQGSIDQFNVIRASGGDPFSDAARASMIGGKEKLALALMMADQAKRNRTEFPSPQEIESERVARALAQF